MAASRIVIVRDIVACDQRDRNTIACPPLDLFADRGKPAVKAPEIELELFVRRRDDDFADERKFVSGTG